MSSTDLVRSNNFFVIQPWDTRCNRSNKLQKQFAFAIQRHKCRWRTSTAVSKQTLQVIICCCHKLNQRSTNCFKSKGRATGDRKDVWQVAHLHFGPFSTWPGCLYRSTAAANPFVPWTTCHPNGRYVDHNGQDSCANG